ncbi:MAG: hypothetical protein LBI89_01225, partial [Prevotellaceae bacterium]|nr:hypothetical protein [Prevotellaceae bacterium]
TITAAAGEDGGGIKWENNSLSASRTVTTSGTYSAVTTIAGKCDSERRSITATVYPIGDFGAKASLCGCKSNLQDIDDVCQWACQLPEPVAGVTETRVVSASNATANQAAPICAAYGLKLMTITQGIALCKADLLCFFTPAPANLTVDGANLAVSSCSAWYSAQAGKNRFMCVK